MTNSRIWYIVMHNSEYNVTGELAVAVPDNDDRAWVEAFRFTSWDNAAIIQAALQKIVSPKVTVSIRSKSMYDRDCHLKVV